MPEERFVGYCRSSTPEQRLGLQIQRDRMSVHAARASGKVITWYEEMRRAPTLSARVLKGQPELRRALAHCRETRATLLVDRVDRLTRSAAFFNTLLETGPPVVVATMPNAPRFVLQIFAVLAEEFVQRVSRRVKATKARARAEGRKLSPHSRQLARGQHKLARARNRPICSAIEDLRRSRSMAASDVARELNERGDRTRQGEQPWTEATVYAVWHEFHRQWRSSRFPGSSKACEAGRAAARHRAEGLRSRIAAYRKDGVQTAREVRDRLNSDGVPTMTGGRWSVGAAGVLLGRLRS
jgi:DNA invertase Pin-like site-specific DNA recombinase